MSGNPKSIDTQEIRPSDQPQLLNSGDIKLSDTTPNFPIGLTSLDIDKSTNPRIKTYIDSVNQPAGSAKVHIDSWNDTILYSAGCQWLEVLADDHDFQAGSFSTLDDHPSDKPQDTTSHEITFAAPYAAAPQVIVWLSCFEMDRNHDWRIKTYTSDITVDGSTIHIDTRPDTILYSGSASWIIPNQSSEHCLGLFTTNDVRRWQDATAENQATIKFNHGFARVPHLWVALNELNIAQRANLRLKATSSNVTTEGFTWHLDARSDTVLYSATASYLAIENF